MTEHPNAEIVRGLFSAFRARDVEAIRNALSETAIWHFPGRTGQLAGDHSGHASIFQFLARVSQLTDGAFDSNTGDTFAFECVGSELVSTDGRGLRGPATHSARNAGTSQYREILVEMKS